MINHLFFVYEFNLNYARALVADIPEDDMFTQPHGLKNHPAWLLGHLSFASDFACTLLGFASEDLGTDWGDLFGNGSKPEPDEELYPDKEELIETLEFQHARLAPIVNSCDESFFEQPLGDDNLREIFPTLGDLITYLMTSHETTHLGQLSSWRRAMGLPMIFG